MKATGTLSLTHERVDDIPLLLGFMQELNLPVLLERHLGSHHLHRGLPNGWLATVWLAFLLLPLDIATNPGTVTIHVDSINDVARIGHDNAGNGDKDSNIRSQGCHK
jgi:hypothetical protein